MPSLALAFDVLARDRASKTFNDVGNAADDAGKKGDRFGKLMSGAGKVAFAGFAAGAAAFAGTLKVGFGELTDYQAGLSQLEAGIKSTGGAAGVTAPQLEDLASKIQGYSGQTDDSIVASEQLLLTFTNIKNAAGANNDVFTQATKATADLAARMGGDAAGSAIQLGKALNDPVKGITALTRVGVSFTEGQKETIKQLVATGDTLGAQKIILGELNKEFGGSAEAYGKTLPGQLAIAKRSFEDVAQSLATALLPILVSGATFLTGTVIPTFGEVAGTLSTLLGPAFSTVKGVVTDFFAGLRSQAGPSGQGVFDFGVKAKGALEQVSGFVTGTAVPAMKHLWDFISTSLVPSIANLVAAVTPKLLGALTDVTSLGVKVFEAALRVLGPVLTGVTGFLRDHKTATEVLAVAIGALLAVTKLHTLFLAVEAVGGLKAYLASTTLVTTATKAWEAVQWLINAALTANPIGIVVVAIGALIAGIILAYQHSETFRKIVTAAFDAAAKAVAFMMDKTADLFSALGHVPGFGWAKTAADAMHGAADAARGLADHINAIPRDVQIRITTTRVEDAADNSARQAAVAGHRALGGSVQAGAAYTVGEFGPERFIPKTAGVIVPTDINGGGVRDEIAALRADVRSLVGDYQRVSRARFGV